VLAGPFGCRGLNVLTMASVSIARSSNRTCGSSPIFLSFVACCAASWTRASSLHQHYPASSVLRSHLPPQPVRPCPSRASGWRAHARHRWGFPCCARSPCTSMPSPLPRQDRRSPQDRSVWLRQLRPFPDDQRVGSCVTSFEVCSSLSGAGPLEHRPGLWPGRVNCHGPPRTGYRCRDCEYARYCGAWKGN
jgi:hypothetical protein